MQGIGTFDSSDIEIILNGPIVCKMCEELWRYIDRWNYFKWVFFCLKKFYTAFVVFRSAVKDSRHAGSLFGAYVSQNHHLGSCLELMSAETTI